MLVFGSIFTNDAVHLNCLGDILMVTPISSTSKRQIKFARYLGAVRRATDRLKKYYQGRDHIQLSYELARKSAFPWPTTYETSNTQVRFTYEAQLYSNILYSFENWMVLVKFTETYSLDLC